MNLNLGAPAVVAGVPIVQIADVPATMMGCMMPKYLEEPKNPGLDDGCCALCGVEGLDEDSRCSGCGYLVCDDHPGDPCGPHFVIDHDDEE